MKLIPMPIQSKGVKMQKSYIQVTYRDIAKMLASALPVEGEEILKRGASAPLKHPALLTQNKES